MLIADKYEVVEEIGRGGMGIVYCVRHVDLDTVFALKMIPHALSEDAATVERFRREARVMAQLNHRHIARVFDLARDGDTYYLIMEFLQGRNLRRYLREQLERTGRPLAVREVLRIGIQVASALAYAHGRMPAIVHRDIKPSNIILEDNGGDVLVDDEGPRAVVTDFGIAKLLGDAQASLTSSQGFVGTLMYSAPEQMRRGLEIDGRADVYALGAVLYELATGTPLYAGHTNQEIVGRVFGGEEADLHALAGVDPALARIVGRAVALAPEARHASARALHADLSAHLRALDRTETGNGDTAHDVPPGTHPADPWHADGPPPTEHEGRFDTHQRALPPRRSFARQAAVATRWLGERAWAIGAVLPALAVAVLCIAEGIAWIGRPFPGFLLLENRVIPTVAGYGWSGTEAGLPFHSTIAAVGGAPVDSSDAVYARVEAVPVGTVLTYTARKAGRVFEIDVPTQRFGPGDYALTFGLMSLNGIVILCMGFATGLLSPRNRPARIFLLMTLMMGLFPLTGVDLYRTHHFPAELHLFLQCLAPATFIHLAAVFPVERVLGRGRRLLAIPYLVGFALAAVVVRAYGAAPPDLTPLYAAYVFAVVGLLTLVASGLAAYVTERQTLVRGRVQVLMIGVVAAFVLPIVGFFDNAFGGGTFPINLIALTPILFFLAVGYAIVKHRLFDAELLVRRGVVLVALLTVSTLLYVAAVSTLNGLLSRTDIAESPLLMAAFMAAALAVALPLREQLGTLIERRLFPAKHRFHETLREISQAITGMRDRDTVLEHVMTTLADAVDATSGAVLLRQEERDALQVAAGFGDAPPAYTIDSARPLARLLATTRSEIFAGDLDEDPALEAIRDDCRPIFASLHAELLLPLIGTEGMVGVLALGHLRTATLTSEDLQLLRALGAAVAVAIVRSRDAVRAEAIAEQRRALRRHLPVGSGRGRPGDEIETPSAQWTHVTALTVRLEKFQALADHVGSEPATRILRQYYGILDHALGAHAGTPERYDGAQLTAVFGTATRPTPHALDAARAALDIRERLERQRSAWRTDGYELALCCGIASGFAHVAVDDDDGELQAFGSTLALAERLCERAEPGTILADPNAVTDLGDSLLHTAIGDVSVPDHRRPLRVSRIEGARAP